MEPNIEMTLSEKIETITEMIVMFKKDKNDNEKKYICSTFYDCINYTYNIPIYKISMEALFPELYNMIMKVGKNMDKGYILIHPWSNVNKEYRIEKLTTLLFELKDKKEKLND